jgi:ketopantoate reductase
VSAAAAPVVVVGLGQLGAVFAEGFLRLGHAVIPVLRGQSLTEKAAGCGLVARGPGKDADGSLEGTGPELVLVAVGEDDLGAVLESIPLGWRERVALLQNELRPCLWQPSGLIDPTIAVIWFEKKVGIPLREVRATAVAGPRRELIVAALSRVGVSAVSIGGPSPVEELAHELALKNLYILCLNLAGLAGVSDAGALLRSGSEVFLRLFEEVFQLELALDRRAGGAQLDRARLELELVAAIQADPKHSARGRSAPQRLVRTLRLAREEGLTSPHLEALARLELPL